MRKRLFRGIVLNGLGSGCVAAVALLRQVLIAQVMGPAAFGLWNLCLVALRLGGECHVGALDTLERFVPIHRGAGRTAEARSLERRAFGVATIFSLGGGLLAGLLLRWQGGSALTAAAVMLGLTMVAQQWFLSDATLVRARGNFGRLTLLQVTFAAVHLVGLVTLVPSRFITGALAAWLIAAVAAALLVRNLVREPLPRPRRSALSSAGDLISRGAPTWLIKVTFILMLQVDRLVIYFLLGDEMLGLYGIIVLGGSVLLFIPDVVTGVLWPVTGERFGSGGEDPALVSPIIERTLRLLAPVLAAVLLLGVQVTEVLVEGVLPNYSGALPALRLHLVAIFFFCLAMPLRFLLVTVNRDKAVLRVQWAMLLLATGATTAAAVYGGGLPGVALAGLVTGVLMFLLVTYCAVTSLGMASRIPAIATGTLLPLLGALALDPMLAVVSERSSMFMGILVRLGVPVIILLLSLTMVVTSKGSSPEASGAGERN